MCIQCMVCTHTHRRVVSKFLTGFFPVSYEEVPCATASQGPVVGVLQYESWQNEGVGNAESTNWRSVEIVVIC